MKGLGAVDGMAFAAESIEIFDFQLLLLEDIYFYGKIEQNIINEKVNCEYAVESIANKRQ